VADAAFFKGILGNYSAQFSRMHPEDNKIARTNPTFADIISLNGAQLKFIFFTFL